MLVVLPRNVLQTKGYAELQRLQAVEIEHYSSSKDTRPLTSHPSNNSNQLCVLRTQKMRSPYVVTSEETAPHLSLSLPAQAQRLRSQKKRNGLEPLAEVERALLVVEVLHAPHPKLGGLLLGLGEHYSENHIHKKSSANDH